MKIKVVRIIIIIILLLYYIIIIILYYYIILLYYIILYYNIIIILLYNINIINKIYIIEKSTCYRLYECEQVHMYSKSTFSKPINEISRFLCALSIICQHFQSMVIIDLHDRLIVSNGKH